MSGAQRGDRAPHNHVTRDVKPRGTCPACDRILDKAAETMPCPYGGQLRDCVNPDGAL